MLVGNNFFKFFDKTFLKSGVGRFFPEYWFKKVSSSALLVRFKPDFPATRNFLPNAGFAS